MKKRFANKYKFTNHGTNKFTFLFQENFYPFEYLEKFNEISLPEKEDFYSNLNTEYMTDADYKHTKSVLKDLEKTFVNNMVYTFKAIYYF